MFELCSRGPFALSLFLLFVDLGHANHQPGFSCTSSTDLVFVTSFCQTTTFCRKSDLDFGEAAVTVRFSLGRTSHFLPVPSLQRHKEAC
ncbi:hypothetical protein GGS20DRAFT_514662 [Poronia punctata]|nr:hypothetical protein GGS20DRAFT_514662 [Poronia punctata]